MITRSLTDRLAATVAGDRAFFQRHRHRRYRLRLAGEAELEELRRECNKPLRPEAGYRWHCLVLKLADGMRLRRFVLFAEGVNVDLPEELVKALWLAAPMREAEGSYLAVSP